MDAVQAVLAGAPAALPGVRPCPLGRQLLPPPPDELLVPAAQPRPPPARGRLRRPRHPVPGFSFGSAPTTEGFDTHGMFAGKVGRRLLPQLHSPRFRPRTRPPSPGRRRRRRRLPLSRLPANLSSEGVLPSPETWLPPHPPSLPDQRPPRLSFSSSRASADRRGRRPSRPTLPVVLPSLAYMAARKDNPVLIACQAPSGRVTRAQAATNRGRFGVAHPVLVSVKTERKPTVKGKTKRGAFDENTSASAVPSAPLPKRRTVLKDVTNISCANSYKKCTAVTKLQSRPSQKIGRILSKNKQCTKKVPKPPLRSVSGTSFVNDSNSVEEIQKAELLAPKEELTVLLENKGSPSLQNIERNRDSGLHEAPFKGFNARHKSETADSKTGDSAGLNIVDIDKDNGNPQICVSYAAEIYTNQMASELIRRPRSNYLETLQRDITKGMRGILIDWLVEVSEEYKLVPDTLYITVYLIDQFLSRKYIERQKLQLLGITSMLIASKYEEICAPRVEEFCFITDNTYTKAEVLKMECQVLNELGFHVSVPTTKTFLRRFLRAAQASHKAPSVTLGYLANYLAELTLTDYSFLKFLPSVVAASAVFLARWTLDQSDLPWNCTLEHYTSYKSSDIQLCVCALRELQQNTSACTLNAIREKYRHQKFECVANLTSPQLAQSLFSQQANDINPLLINNP